MQIGLCQAAGLVMLIMTGTAWGQTKLACDSKGNVKTPELVEGQVSTVDQTHGKLTIRDSRGKDYDFHASSETLQDIKIGDNIKAKLRETLKCPEK